MLDTDGEEPPTLRGVVPSKQVFNASYYLERNYMSKKTTIDTSMFWNINQTLTHNALVNVIVGNRGGGKSYGFKERAIENYIRKGEQFGYVRRYKEDLSVSAPQFFKDIAGAYPDHEFKYEGGKFYIRERPATDGVKWAENDVAGYTFVLSTANNRKSVSYPNITLLGFDEFLLEKGSQRYLAREPEKLLNLYETIARPGTGHPRVVIFLLANAITITNPYFLYWKLSMPTKQDGHGKWIWKHPTRPILVEDVRNEKFIDVKRNTEFGALVEGTQYSDYSIENKFLQDDIKFIEKKSPEAKYFFSFIYRNEKYGVWISYEEGKMWVSNSVDPSFPICYAITMKDHSPNTMFLKNRSKAQMFRTFIDNYKLGNVYFENMNIKNLCYEVIQLSMNV